MKIFEMLNRQRTPLVVLCCFVCLCSAAPAAFSQQLQSGALLTITSSDMTVNRAVYDSQIHSGIVQVSPCDAVGVVTDAYVLQGGSPTGCDNGDAYEVTSNSESVHQSPGNATISGAGYSFAITTFYQLGGCNTAGTICANPDTGFLTVKNNGPAPFTGTLALQGNSPLAGDPYCPVSGVANDSFTGTLAAGASVTLALGSQGSSDTAKLADSSNCGGFTQSQTQTLTPGGMVKFPFGPDESGPGPLPGADYILAGITNTGGEVIQFDLVPVLQSNLNPGHTLSNTFDPGTNFSRYTCDAYGDLSETGNHVCAEIHLGCSVGGVTDAGDCATFFYTLTADYTVPSDVSGAGNALLEDTVRTETSSGSCPSNSWNTNIFYTVTVDEVKKKGGSNPASSCFVAANGVVNGNPAPLVTQGQTFVSFEGLEFPFKATPPQLNFWPAGLIAPLTFDYINPNLTSAMFSPEAFPISCSTRLPLGPAVPISGHLFNLTKLFPRLFPVEHGLTEYVFNWQTVKGSTGCFSVVLNFTNGPSIVVAQQFKLF